jgi:signal transduction histidine kinase
VRVRLFQTESFRLAAIYAGLFLVSTLLLMTIVFMVVSHAFEENLLRASNDDLAAIRRAYAEGKPRGKALHEATEMVDDRLLAADAADLFLLQSGSRKIAGNLPPMPGRTGVLRYPYPALPGQDAIAGHIILGNGAFLGGGNYAFVGRDLQAARDAENEVIVTFGFVLAVSLLIATAAGMLLSRSFVRRVDAITATCRAIMSGRLGERVPFKGSRNELDQLAAAINDMLNRIAALMESLRQVSNDIAHDMRTPLTHLRYRLESAQHNSKSMTDFSASVQDAISDCDQLLDIFSALLRIAQIEAGARRAVLAPLDMSEVLHKVADFYEPVMHDTGHLFVAGIEPKLRVKGERQLLFRLFANLLDNAIRHTAKGTAVALHAWSSGDHVWVTVGDNGTGIPPQDRERVFRRFYRREQSRTTPGTGLGLSLVSAIAELHGTKVALEDNDPGLRAKIAFDAIDAAILSGNPPTDRSLANRKDYSPNDHQSYSKS